jgi:hypothetical protein
MICYHNLGEIAHDVVTACPVRIGIKKRARCCDYWELRIKNIRKLLYQISVEFVFSIENDITPFNRTNGSKK